jgi:hypothetical protein
MPDNHMIFDQGFKNVLENGRITGFQLKVQNMNYRGVPLSLVQGIEVTVDGEVFKEDQIRCTVRGRTYTLAEMEKIGDNQSRWPWLEPVTLTVSKAGGLKQGVHSVKVRMGIRVSYMEVVPTVYTGTRSLTIVQ